MNFAALNWVSLFFMHFISHIMKRFLKAWSTVQNSNDFLKLISDLDNNRICSWKMMIFTFFFFLVSGDKMYTFSCLFLSIHMSKKMWTITDVGWAENIFSLYLLPLPNGSQWAQKTFIFHSYYDNKNKIGIFCRKQMLQCQTYSKKSNKMTQMNEVHFAMKKVDQVK